MKETDIRPNELYQKYLDLTENDVEEYFNAVDLHEVNCPACNAEQKEFAFDKNKFKYFICSDCSTLYQSPRPKLKHFEKFYQDSPSSNYWAEVFFPQVAEVRREKMFMPRAKQAAELCKAEGFVPKNIVDVGAGYGLFLEEWKKLYKDAQLFAVEPSKIFADSCRRKNIEVLEVMAEEAGAWAGKADLLTCFEVLEHSYDPYLFVQSLYRLIKPGGHILLTALCIEGFDIQILWDKSKSILPPLHLSFMSLKGFERLFSRAGFNNIRIMTPGELDVDIVLNALRERPECELSRFEKTLLSRDSEALKNFQKFLSGSQLSSHTWIFAEK